MNWLGSNPTGWGAFGALAFLVVVGFITERFVARRAHDRDLREADAAMARALADKDELVAFFREAHKIERERNDVLAGGLMTMMTETRNAVLGQNRAA